MLSSLATFLFGAQPNSELPTNSNAASTEQQQQQQTTNADNDESGDVIEVTSSTPSVAGNNRGTVRQSGKQRAGKNRRGKQRQQQQGGQRKATPSITKLLTPGDNSVDEDFDEDEWYIVEKEDKENDSLPRSDSEEELTAVEAAQGKPAAGVIAAAASSSRRRQHYNSHSLYSGPRPQQQRNYLQHARAARPLSISTLSPPRSVPGGRAADNGVTQSLYAPSPAVSPCGSDASQGGPGANVLMEESWYVTPPPCFTSIGPINMETSPFENLLIEHPSMSVYHSIRSSHQEANESFINLDLGVVQEQQEAAEQPADNQQQTAVQPRGNNARFDHQAAVQLKQQTLERHSQKSKKQKQHQQLGRSAIQRSNKVREYQAKASRPRRSDMQHCKLVSGANNNRKCCF